MRNETLAVSMAGMRLAAKLHSPCLEGLVDWGSTTPRCFFGGLAGSASSSSSGTSRRCRFFAGFCPVGARRSECYYLGFLIASHGNSGLESWHCIWLRGCHVCCQHVIQGQGMPALRHKTPHDMLLQILLQLPGPTTPDGFVNDIYNWKGSMA